MSIDENHPAPVNEKLLICYQSGERELAVMRKDGHWFSGGHAVESPAFYAKLPDVPKELLDRRLAERRAQASAEVQRLEAKLAEARKTESELR